MKKAEVISKLQTALLKVYELKDDDEITELVLGNDNIVYTKDVIFIGDRCIILKDKRTDEKNKKLK